jgi:hypothetical protein
MNKTKGKRSGKEKEWRKGVRGDREEEKERRREEKWKWRTGQNRIQ